MSGVCGAYECVQCLFGMQVPVRDGQLGDCQERGVVWMGATEAKGSGVVDGE